MQQLAASAVTVGGNFGNCVNRRGSCHHLQCGRDVVSGTVNVTVCLHSAHPANTWCSALTNSTSILC
jgi:hypothetical protein